MPPLLGKRVRLSGLVSKPSLNGQCGKATSFDVTKGRYHVELDGETLMSLKAANLQEVADGQENQGTQAASSGAAGASGSASGSAKRQRVKEPAGEGDVVISLDD